MVICHKLSIFFQEIYQPQKIQAWSIPSCLIPYDLLHHLAKQLLGAAILSMMGPSISSDSALPATASEVLVKARDAFVRRKFDGGFSVKSKWNRGWCVPNPCIWLVVSNMFFSFLFGGDSHFDEHIFQMGKIYHQLDMVGGCIRFFVQPFMFRVGPKKAPKISSNDSTSKPAAKDCFFLA